MSSNVLKIYTSAPEQLRILADRIESGEFINDGVTVIAGTEVFHCSSKPDTVCVTNTVWDCTYAIHKLMGRALDR